MKIVDRATFLAMPAGVAYVKVPERWAPSGGLSFKEDTCRDHEGRAFDWWSLDPAWVDGNDCGECTDRLDEMIDHGASYPMQVAVGRDGLFDEGDMFMVFEADDLDKLAEAIQKARSVAP
jgi:hypothetical protein